jgi:hypothetical protein
MQLTKQEQHILLEKFFPLGRVPRYDFSKQSIQLSDTSARRFILEAGEVKRSSRAEVLTNPDKYNPEYIGFGFFESLAVIIQDDYQLYKKLFDFFTKIETVANSLISECSQAAVVCSHTSFGDRLFPHIHQDSGMGYKTLSIFVKLTDITNESPVLKFFDTLDVESKCFKKGYTDHKLLLVHERKSTDIDNIVISNNMCVLFDAYKIPHSLAYADDIWATVVYDNVLLKPEAETKFINKGRYDIHSVEL